MTTKRVKLYDLQNNELVLEGSGVDENQLHALKGYFEDGTLYTDDTLYASTFTNSSTVFASNYFVKASTPVISADGFAYDFANGKYVRSTTSIDCRYPFTIIVNEQKTVTNNKFQGFGLSRTDNIAYPLVFCQPGGSGWFAIGYYINNQLKIYDIQLNEQLYTSIDYIISWDGEHYKFEVRNALNGETIVTHTMNETSPLYRGSYTGYIVFGWNYNAGKKMELTDLKRARLYTNNDLIWSGSKMATDTIENYLVAGTPTISGGVVSDFSSANYIDTKRTLTGDTWEIDIPFTTGASFNANDRIIGCIATKYGIVLGQTATGALVLWASSNGTSWDIANSVNSGSKVLSANTPYYITVKFTGTQYLVDVASASSSTNYITVSSSTKVYNHGTVLLGIYLAGAGDYYLRFGSIDLNGFKILQDGHTVYDAYSSIPYIQAQDGAKIVDINKQYKVKQASEFGKSGYYVINNLTKQVSLPAYELYGLASKSSNSPFVIVDYTE